MNSTDLFDVAMRQNRWLSQRLSVVAGNVANANTPDFKARDIAPFAATLSAMDGGLRTTSRTHLTSGVAKAAAITVEEAEPVEVHHSGNAVNLDLEFLKVGDINRSIGFNVGAMKAFQRMLASSTRG